MSALAATGVTLGSSSVVTGAALATTTLTSLGISKGSVAFRVDLGAAVEGAAGTIPAAAPAAPAAARFGNRVPDHNALR